MSAQVDHVAAAKDWIENSVKAQASQQPNNEQLAAAYAAVGQVHATLALVEQQRIANLIALAGLPKIDGFENEVYDATTEALMKGLVDSQTVAAVPGYGPAGLDQSFFIRPEIQEALGLS